METENDKIFAYRSKHGLEVLVRNVVYDISKKVDYIDTEKEFKMLYMVLKEFPEKLEVKGKTYNIEWIG